MENIDVLRSLWKRIENPSVACPSVSFDRILGAMCDILAEGGFGGGNTPSQCWILAYVSIVEKASILGIQSLREQTLPFPSSLSFEEEDELYQASNKEVERELEDLRFRGFLVREGNVYKVKP
jgi:hypothetical protein